MGATKWVSIKVFLIELVCKREATSLQKPLASVPFAPCPPIPQSPAREKRGRARGQELPTQALPCCPALPHPCSSYRASLLLLQLTAPERGMLAEQLKRKRKRGVFFIDIRTLLRMLHLSSWAELWGAKCFAPALLDLSWHGISFH